MGSGVCCPATLTFLSLSVLPLLWMCVCVGVYVCVCSLWSTALAQKRRPGRPILCVASCRKLVANYGSMRRCCFVWSDKVQPKPSGLHWPVAVFIIVAQALNAGLCDARLMLNIR